MKQYLQAFSILFFSALFILTACGMSFGAIEGMREDFVLETAMSVWILGPLSLVALACVTASMKAGFDEKNYQSMRPIIIVFAAIQLILMGTYIAIVWSRK